LFYLFDRGVVPEKCSLFMPAQSSWNCVFFPENLFYIKLISFLFAKIMWCFFPFCKNDVFLPNFQLQDSILI
jgi:hypothetical protein